MSIEIITNIKHLFIFNLIITKNLTMEQEYNELEEFDLSVVPNVRPGMFVSGW